MSLQVNPYIVLDGQAMEALRFYEKALGAKVVGVMTFGEMPGDPNQPLPEAAKNRVAHGHLMIGDSNLMLSDTFPGQPLQFGDQVNILVYCKTADEARKVFDALAEGGQVLMPLEKTFWSPAYGSLKDKFGVTFQVTTEGEQK